MSSFGVGNYSCYRFFFFNERAFNLSWRLAHVHHSFLIITVFRNVIYALFLGVIILFEIFIKLYGWEQCDHITVMREQTESQRVCRMFCCLPNEKSNIAFVVARYMISYGIYNKIIHHSVIPSTCVRSICLYLATSFPGSLGCLVRRKVPYFISKS